MFISNAIKSFQPLVFYKNKLISIKGNKLYFSTPSCENYSYFASIPLSFSKLLFSKLNFLSKIFRLHVRCAIVTKSNILFINMNKIIYYIDLDNDVSEINVLDCNYSPLNFTDVSHCSDYHILFGDYLTNSSKSNVPIIGVNKIDYKVEVIYMFPESKVNHVHNIIVSEDQSFCFVLCGDFGDSSSIYRLNLNDFSVEIIVKGKQLYRACWGFHLDDFFYYCTDTQFEQNYFVRLSLKSHSVEILSKINGSVIYGSSNVNGEKYFSTSVEPDYKSNILLDYLSNDRGPGINSNFAVLYKVHGVDVKPILFLENDFLPLKLFGFATFMFPSGENSDNGSLVVFSKSVKTYDCYTLVFRK